MSLFSSGIVHPTEQTGVLPTRTKAHWENGSPPNPTVPYQQRLGSDDYALTRLPLSFHDWANRQIWQTFSRGQISSSEGCNYLKLANSTKTSLFPSKHPPLLTSILQHPSLSQVNLGL